MTPRLIPLATAAALLSLTGCATQQTAADIADASNQRMSGIEARLQAEAGSTQGLLGALGRKIDTLSAEMRHLDGKIAHQGNAAATLQQSLTTRLEKAEQRLEQLSGETRAALTKAGEANVALTGLRGQLEESGQRIERLGAGVNYRNMEQNLTRDAENAELSARQEDTETLLDEMAGQIEEMLAQFGAMEAAMPQLGDKVEGAQQSAELAGQRLEELAEAAGERFDALEAATGEVLAAQAALVERTTRSDTRLNDYDARLAALSKRLEEVAAMAQEAYDATGLGQRKIFGKVVESITLTEDKTLFPINSPELGEQDKAKLDALVTRLKTLGTNYHLQIQGHTEGFGADDYNYALGKARAEVVKNYLKEKGGIPLLRMSVMSYGSLEARGQIGGSNRRIVVQVLQ